MKVRAVGVKMGVQPIWDMLNSWKMVRIGAIPSTVHSKRLRRFWNSTRSFDEYGLVDLDNLVEDYEANYQAGKANYPNQVFTGGHYNTIVSAAIQAFGYEYAQSAAADRQRFDKVIESFFQLTLHDVKAWAKTSIEVFIQHDDMVWNRWCFMQPAYYRSAIFPRYQKLWQVLHEAGKIVLFCSDGNFTRFVDDIAAAEADASFSNP